MKLIKVGETTASKKRVQFLCVDASDGMTPEIGEAGGQPEISWNGGAYTSTGIGVLVDLGDGNYYAELTDGVLATTGVTIHPRYKSANTLEAVGTPVQVVAFDPDDAADLGLTNLDDAITDIPTLVADLDLATYEAAAKTGTKLGSLIVATRAGIAGKMTISGTTVTLYEVDGTTAIWTATLDDATAPTERGAPA